MRTLLILVGTINLLTMGCQTATKKSTCGSACGSPCGQCATAHAGIANVNTEVVNVAANEENVVKTGHVQEQTPPFEVPENPFEELEVAEETPAPNPQPEQITIPEPQRGHGKNYEWLVGTLQRVHSSPKHQWKIRYADLDQHDKWGGSVILAPDARLDNWKDGDMVYVEGEVLTARPSLYLTGALYRIHSIRSASEVTQIIPR